MRTFLKNFVPGHQGALLVAATMICACQATMPWITLGSTADHPSWYQFGVMGAAVTWAMLLQLWIVFGDGSLLRRCTAAFGWAITPELLAMLNTCWYNERDLFETPVIWRVLVLALAYRLLMVAIFGVISICVQSMVRWRIARITPKSNVNVSPLRIYEVMLLTVAVAVSIVGARETVGSSVADFGPIVQPVGELGIFLFGVLPPTLICMFWSRLQKGLWWVWPAWVASVAIPLAFTFISLQPTLFEALIFAVVLALIAAGLAGFGVWIASWYGYQFVHPQKDGQIFFRSNLGQFRGTGVLYALLLTGPLLAFHHTYDIRMLTDVEEVPWEIARLSRQVSRVVGQSAREGYNGRLSWRLNGDLGDEVTIIEIGDSVFEFYFEGGVPPVEAIEMVSMDGATSATFRLPYSAMTAEMFRAMDALKSIETLNLYCDDIDLVGLKAFLTRTKPESLAFKTASISLIEVIKSSCEPTDVAFVDTFELTDEIAIALRGLSVTSLDLTDKDGVIPKIQEFDLVELAIRDSPISDRTAKDLTQLSTLKALIIQDCELTPEMIASWSKLNVDSLEIVYTKTDCPTDMLLPLADNHDILTIDGSGPNVTDDLFAARFNRRRGYVAASCYWEDGSDSTTEYFEDVYQRNATALDLLVLEKGRSIQEALKKVAHSYDVNDKGELCQIDIQGLAISDSVAEMIGSLTGLKEIRYGVTQYESYYAPTDLTSVLASSKLTSLTVVSENVDDETLQRIGRMTGLKRLQLPCPDCNTWFPERIPLQIDNVDGSSLLELATTNEWNIDNNYYYNTDKSTDLSDGGLNHLSNLKELEFLFIPGFMLSNDSMSTIMEFPKLRELHAPFSAADTLVLSDLSTMTKLQTLSVGVMENSTSELKRLKTLTQLKQLQVFVFGNNFSDNNGAQQDLYSTLSQLLPNAEVYVVTVRED